MLGKKKILTELSFRQKSELDYAMSKEIKRKIGEYKPNGSRPLVKVNHLQKIYNELSARRRVVLWDMDFTIYEGDCIALVGANGSGKSTLIEILARVRGATCGEIFYNFDYKISPEENIGIQFQKSSYPSGITINNVIDFILNTRKIKLDKVKRYELLKIFGLDSLVKQNIRNLSGGQRQRVNVVLSILHKPAFLLLDELTTGLDIVSQNQILKYLKIFLTKNKTTTIMSSHSIKEMDTVCNRLIMIRDGYIMADANIDVIRKKFGSVDIFLQKYMGG